MQHLRYCSKYPATLPKMHLKHTFPVPSRWRDDSESVSLTCHMQSVPAAALMCTHITIVAKVPCIFLFLLLLLRQLPVPFLEFLEFFRGKILRPLYSVLLGATINGIDHTSPQDGHFRIASA